MRFFVGTHSVKRAVALVAIVLCACDDDVSGPDDDGMLPSTPFVLSVDGRGDVADRYTGELWVRANLAYTTTWGGRSANGILARGNAIKIWNVAAAPVLLDSVIVANTGTIGDVQVTTDGRYLVVATEPQPGSLVIYDLQDPIKPRLLSRFQSPETDAGVHTATLQTVNGTLYAFLAIDPRGGVRGGLVILDLSDPASPRQVFARTMGSPYVHDVFVRDGILMTAQWDDGIVIFDIGGGGRGGTVASPVQIGSISTVGGNAHNIHWFHDTVTGSKRYAFVGEEGPASIGSSASGDVHVVDVSDLANPREVAFFSVPGAGTHNFAADEQRGILYAAYYNGGVRALSVRGDLSSCAAGARSPDGRCDLGKMGREVARGLLDVGRPVFIWGVHFTGANVYASDMLNGLWRLSPVPAF